LKKRIERNASADVANLFLHLLGATEFDARLAVRVCGVHSGFDSFVGEKLRERTEFSVKVPVCLLLAEEVAPKTF
jgi:hypothetical protein